jgi:hypothetical protein
MMRLRRIALFAVLVITNLTAVALAQASSHHSGEVRILETALET